MPDRKRGARSCVAALVLLNGSQIYASDWDFKAKLSAVGTYTDNLNLAPLGQETSETIAQINPGLSIAGDGARLKLNLGYNMQNLFYSNDSSNNRTFHQFISGLQSELIKDWFYFDWNGQVSQELLSPEDGISEDNLNPNTGRGDVVSTSYSPQIRRRLGRDVALDLVYTEGRVNYSSGAASDTKTQSTTFDLGRGRDVSGLDWHLSLADFKSKPESSTPFTTQTAQARAGVRILSETRIVAYAGREQGEINSSTNYQDGNYWSAGLYWTPSPKFSLELTKGDNDQQAHLRYSPSIRTQISVSNIQRDVGIRPSSAWLADISHRTRRSVWTLRYSEDVTSDAILAVTGQENVVRTSDDGEFEFDEQGVPIIDTRNITEVVDEEFTRANASGSVSYNTGKSKILLLLSAETRDYELSGRHTDSNSVHLNWNYKIKARTSLNVGHSLVETKELGVGKSGSRVNNVSLNRNISQRASAQLMWRQADVEQTNQSNNYRENRISASFTITTK